MKCLSLFLLAMLPAAGAIAQTPTNPTPASVTSANASSANVTPAPGVEVTAMSWRKESFVPALYDDPLARNQEHADLEREQKRTIRQNVVRVQSGQLPLPVPTRPATTTRSGLSSIYYRYDAKVKSAATKTIREIAWEYSLYEPETEVQIGRHQYTSKVNLRPGKATILTGVSDTPPNGVVSVAKSGKELRSKYLERVVINRIEYDDGTFWQRPVN